MPSRCSQKVNAATQQETGGWEGAVNLEHSKCEGPKTQMHVWGPPRLGVQKAEWMQQSSKGLRIQRQGVSGIEDWRPPEPREMFRVLATCNGTHWGL